MENILSNYLIDESMTIIDALRQINKGEKSVVFVLKNNRLVAALSDGDVRRYIINGGDLAKTVKEIANYSPVYVHEKDEVNYSKLMREHSITALPLVDDCMTVIDIKFISNPNPVVDKLDIPVVIMAGGIGSRLRPFTEILPKPLIPIGNKTITEHIIDRFNMHGCTHFDMIVNYKKNLIKSFFQDNEYKYDVSFVEEPEYWGTAGGLKLIEGKYDGAFFITNCDILIEEDYKAIYDYHKKNNNIITLVCAKKQVVLPYGTVDVDENGNLTAFREKPSFEFKTNTGLYIAEQEFLEEIPENTRIDITDVIENCVKKGKKVGVYLISEDSWMDMGQMEELKRMEKRLNAE
ncbi:MAG: NTP transferase domain-containing protein [Lachnospiraceae bacterium]|nr:NTP transferase domain-containing protein [Lachnospiraceae bacterium]